MKALLSIIFLLFFSTLVFSEEIKGELIIEPNQSVLKEGDLIEGLIRFWPLENADLKQIRLLEKTVLFQSLYLASIDSLEPSENNADVVELKGKFFVKNAKPSNIDFLKYNDIKIPINIKSIEIKDLPNKQEKFYIAEQDVGKTYWVWIQLALLAIVVFLLILFKDRIKIFFNKITKKPIFKRRKFYDDMFRKANSRKDFEEIYSLKRDWQSLLESESPAYRDFFQVLNGHQFKKDWTNEEMIEVRTAFDNIRRSFES